MFDEFKKTFTRQTATQIIATELAEAELALLRAETGVEYASALVVYNKNRIKRLKAYLEAAA
jgi:hypothetical protein